MKRSISIYLLTALCMMLYNCGEDELKNSFNEGGLYDIVVVGGGFSGLTAAYYLNNKKVLVLEKESKLGGRCQSGTWEHFHYPKGTEYIGTPEIYLTKFFNNIGLRPMQVPAPTDGVAYKGKLYLGNQILDYLGTKEIKSQYYQLEEELTTLSEAGVDEAVFDNLSLLTKYSELDNQTVKEWLDSKGYDPIIQKFVDVENRGLFGASNKDLSMLFNIPEMAYDLPDSTYINESETFTFTNGMYSIVENLAELLKNKVVTGALVTEVKVNADKTVSIKYTKDGESKEVQAKTVIMATPANITEKITANGLSDQVRSALSGIEYSQYITINFFVSERVLNQTWSISCVDENFVSTIYDAVRMQVDANYTGKSILGVYMAPLDISDKTFADKSDDELLNSAYSTLNKYFPGVESKVSGYDITRFKTAFPVYGKNYSEKALILSNDNSVKGPIFLAGDYFFNATFDGAFLSGEKAAEDAFNYLDK